MPVGHCFYTTRQGLRAFGKKTIPIFILLFLVLCAQIATAQEGDGSKEENGSEEDEEEKPVMSTTWLATYKADSPKTISNECGKHYASHFLQEFLRASDELQGGCGAFPANVAISSVARVRLQVSKISLDTFLKIKGQGRNAIVNCLKNLNTTFQDISSIADVSTIPNNTEHSCSSVTMESNVLEYKNCHWECLTAGYIFNGSASCDKNTEHYTWECQQTCEDIYASCFHGLAGRSHSKTAKCNHMNKGLNCLRNRRDRYPERYAYCWFVIKGRLLKQIEDARAEDCMLDDSEIDPTDYPCTTTPSTTQPTPTTTTTTPANPDSTIPPPQWSMKLIKIEDNSVPQNNGQPYIISLEEGGSTVNVTFEATVDKFSVCHGKLTCDIFVDIKFAAGSDPVCRKGKQPISQIVTGRPWLDGVLVPETEAGSFCQVGLQMPLVEGLESTHIIIIPLRARVDNKYDGQQMRQMVLSLLVIRRQIGPDDVYSARSDVDILVQIKDRDTIATCSSINDPHLTTFDGLSYDNMYQGEFIMYKHKTLPYEVHTVYQACAPGITATCNCALAAKIGDDVFLFDRCRQKKPKFQGLGGNRADITIYKTSLYLHGEIVPGTSIRQKGDGKRYILYLPSGTYIKILLNAELINVWIVASTNDIEKTEGLCGTYDGNKNNDLIMRNGDLVGNDDTDTFSLNWRVDIGGPECLLNGAPVSTDIFEPDVYCRCEMDGTLCDFALDVETCDIYEGKSAEESFLENAIEPNQAIVLSRRRKRQTDENEVIKYNVDTEAMPPESKWESEEEEMEARLFCNNFIRNGSELARLCTSEITGVTFMNQIEVCVEDIKITKSKSWADSALAALKESCLEQILKNGSIPDDVANKILGAMCVQDCSGPDRGRCINGTCVCNEGYGGPDCSIDLNAPPISAELPRYGLCDRKVSNCRQVIVYGENFLDSPQLVCLLTAAIIYESGFELGENSTKKASFINFNAVECPIPIIQPYLIYVSNDDGLTSSEPLLYIPYDSSCKICSTNITGCHLKVGSCFIRDNCYQRGELNEENTCLVCRPEKQVQEWSEADACTTPLVTDAVVAGISAVFGTLIGVGIGILIYVFCCKSRKTPQRGIPMEGRGSEQLSATLQPVNDDMLHRNHTPSNEFPENLDSGRNNYRGYVQDYGQGVENGVDDTTYF